MLVQLYQGASPRKVKKKKKKTETEGLSGTQQLIYGKEEMRIPKQDRSREVKHKIHVLGKGDYGSNELMARERIGRSFQSVTTAPSAPAGKGETDNTARTERRECWQSRSRT